EEALTAMLRERRLAGAALDVFEHEPAINPQLRDLDNVLLLPHMGSATLEARIDMGEKVLVNIRTFVDGHQPPDRVIAKLM
ncbi:MAG: putative 2-hydroxyacid dehydrogenase, partial [Alphaproteobacteria bacterium MarineAlpha9_Bin7]